MRADRKRRESDAVEQKRRQTIEDAAAGQKAAAEAQAAAVEVAAEVAEASRKEEVARLRAERRQREVDKEEAALAAADAEREAVEEAAEAAEAARQLAEAEARRLEEVEQLRADRKRRQREEEEEAMARHAEEARRVQEEAAGAERRRFEQQRAKEEQAAVAARELAEADTRSLTQAKRRLSSEGPGPGDANTNTANTRDASVTGSSGGGGGDDDDGNDTTYLAKNYRFACVGGDAEGPVNAADLLAMQTVGVVDDATLVWTDGWTNWITFVEAQPLLEEEERRLIDVGKKKVIHRMTASSISSGWSDDGGSLQASSANAANVGSTMGGAGDPENEGGGDSTGLLSSLSSRGSGAGTREAAGGAGGAGGAVDGAPGRTGGETREDGQAVPANVGGGADSCRAAVAESAEISRLDNGAMVRKHRNGSIHQRNMDGTMAKSLHITV